MNFTALSPDPANVVFAVNAVMEKGELLHWVVPADTHILRIDFSHGPDGVVSYSITYSDPHKRVKQQCA